MKRFINKSFFMKKIGLALLLLTSGIQLTFADTPEACVKATFDRYHDGDTQLVFECGLRDTDTALLSDIVNFTNNHAGLNELWLIKNKIGNEGAKIIANVKIDRLLLDFNQIGDDGAAALSQNTSIKYLSLDKNKITDKGMAFLASNKTLGNLDVYENKFTDKSCEFFSTNATLHSLGIGHNNLTSACAISLAKNKFITGISIDRNPIGDEGAIALSNMPQLTGLSLWYTGISDISAQAISSKLIQLEDLEAGGNKLTSQGVKNFFNLQRMMWLDLGKNKIDDEGVDAVSKLPHLVNLSLDDNDISDEGARIIADNVTQYNQSEYPMQLVISGNPRLTQAGLTLLRNTPKISLYETGN